MTKTTDRIVETAERLFYSNGFNNTGVDLIRDEANCSKTTMYKSFGNKDNLTLAVLKSRDMKFRSSLKNFVGTELKNLEAVAKIFEWHEMWFRELSFNGCLFVRASYELQRENTEIYQVVLDHKLWVKKFIEERLSEECSQNVNADFIMVLLEGLISLHSIYREEESRAPYLDLSLEVIKARMKGELP